MTQPNDRRKTYEEVLQSFMELLEPEPPPPPPKTAAVKAEERWAAQQKPISAVLQDARRAEDAATERLRREREERSAKAAAEHQLACYQAEIDAAWQRSLDYQAELSQWGSHGFHRGPGDSDWGL
jgi:hypothetical protein